MAGKGRGVFREFKMARVRFFIVRTPQDSFTNDVQLQYQFRLNALEGNLPGVKKASW